MYHFKRLFVVLIYLVLLIYEVTRPGDPYSVATYFGVLQIGIKSQAVFQLFQADSAVTYTSVHSEARSWSIPSEDPYEEAARQLLEQAPLPAEDEAPIEAYIIEVASAPPPPPSFLPLLI
ncbi:hypothetical protein Tco_1273827 [Tanacetum coccineum]